MSMQTEGVRLPFMEAWMSINLFYTMPLDRAAQPFPILSNPRLCTHMAHPGEMLVELPCWLIVSVVQTPWRSGPSANTTTVCLNYVK